MLLVLLALAAIAVWLVFAPPWGSAGASGEPGASVAPSAAPSAQGSAPAVAPSPPASEPEAIAPCTAAEVSVEPLTDLTEYAAGQQPQLTLRLQNTSDRSCTMNVGTSTQRFEVTSGSDVWWRSSDCQQNASDLEVTLTAGQLVESSVPVVWDRTRSSPASCEGGREPAPAGGASYHLSVSVGGIDSAVTKQILLY